MTQLLAHLFGDYILQSEWMAVNKSKRTWPAFVHALLYSLCFVPLCWHVTVWTAQVENIDGFFIERMWGTAARFHWLALLVIFSTHFLIDRFRLARYVVWAKNWMGPRKMWYRRIAGGVPMWTDQWDETDPCRTEVDNYYKFNQPTPPLWACPTGYPPTTPPWLSTWLLIIADNTLHLAINYAALRWL